MRMRSVSLILALLWAAAIPAASSEGARAWIERMNSALKDRNYDGVLTHKWMGGGESLRLIHRMRNGRMTERVVSTDGSRHEEIRNGELWARYLPEKRSVLTQTRNRSFGYIATLNGLTESSGKNYNITNGGTQSLLGWPNQTQLISVEPRDALRYGYRFWLDLKTAMPIRTQLVTGTGEVIDEISFSSLRLRDNISDEELKPAVDDRKFRWWSLDVPAEAVTQAFVPRADLLPPGFRLLPVDAAGSETQVQGPKNRFIVSDGVTWVSVFIAPADKERREGRGEPMGTGISETYVRKLDQHYVTVMGDVPSATVKAIALAVQPE